MPRLLDKYRTDVAPALKKQFGYSSEMAIPKLAKIVVNMGVGEAIADAKLLDQAVDELAAAAAAIAATGVSR